MRFAGCSPYPTQDVIYMALMALRETTEDLTEFTPGRCRYDRSPYSTQDVLYIALMALRETTEDSTEFTPGRCRYD